MPTTKEFHSSYEVKIGKEKQLQFQAKIQIPLDYPHSPPLFKLQEVSQNKSFEMILSNELISKMDEGDLRKMEEMRPKGGYLVSGEPILQILNSIEDETQIYYEEYCNKKKYQDFLISFQIRKLLNCFEILNETSKIDEKKGQNLQSFGIANLYKKAVKGRFKKRPFCFNENQNLFEQR